MSLGLTFIDVQEQIGQTPIWERVNSSPVKPVVLFPIQPLNIPLISAPPFLTPGQSTSVQGVKLERPGCQQRTFHALAAAIEDLWGFPYACT